jgi:hypothetical protein
MKLVIPEQAIEYDFVLVYPAGVTCPYKLGQNVKSPVRDGRGSIVCFVGSAEVVYTVAESVAGQSGFTNTIYVKQSVPWRGKYGLSIYADVTAAQRVL